MSLEVPDALRVEPGRIPDALPTALEEIAPPLHSSQPVAGQAEPTTLFLTVDVEDAYFKRPILMTGDGIGPQFGVYGILDRLDAHGMKATLFVNVYEKDRQPSGVVEGVVREIVARGHEVGLHSHPVPELELYRRPLIRLSRSAQVDILRWGVELIDRWTGRPPVSFRAGGYALNDDTFAAMEEVGIAIDSSCFFPSPNNCHAPFTVNAVAARGPIVEVPVTTVLRVQGDKTVSHRKLDFNWLSVDGLMSALGAVSARGAGFATFMMHSFSFIDKATRREAAAPARRPVFTSEDTFGWRVDVFGPRPEMPAAFSSLLDRVAADPLLRVRTLAEALPELRAAAAGPSDLIPVVSGE
ncbi:MAG TPA: polysaccharide deacetylase family protein [Solirubrobacterales bacterium]